MKKTVAFVLALLLLCGSAICEGLAETNRGGGYGFHLFAAGK